MKTRNLIIASVVATIQLLGSFQIVSAQMPGQTVGSLPPLERAEILSMLVSGTVLLRNCSLINTGVPQVQYLMYNRQNPTGYVMTNFDNVDYSKGVYILLYGWFGYKDVDYMLALRGAYLQRFDTNVITVDYPDSVDGDYGTAFCSLPAIANNLSRFLCMLARYYDLSQLHILGYSFGAHLGGSAGRQVRELCQLNVGRITGLEPAGPGFQDRSTTDILDATDANFVDVIHTNQGQFGYVGNAGDIDFYVNCGSFQPGCLPIFENFQATTDINNLQLTTVDCNHARVCFVFAESILRNDFLATPRMSPLLCDTPPTTLSDSVYMGQYCNSPQQSHSYYVDTNAVSPYGMGPSGPLQ